MNKKYLNKQNDSFEAKWFGNKEFIKNFWKLLWPQLILGIFALLINYIEIFSFTLIWKNNAEALAAKQAIITADFWKVFQGMFVGALAGGSSIILSQYYGVNDEKGVHTCINMKFITLAIGFGIIILFTEIYRNQTITLTSNIKEGLAFDLSVYAYYWTMPYFIVCIIFYTLFQSLTQIKESKKSLLVNIPPIIINIIFVPVAVLCAKNDIYYAVKWVCLISFFEKFLAIIIMMIFIFYYKITFMYFWRNFRITKDFLSTWWKPSLIIFITFGTLSVTDLILKINIMYYKVDFQDLNQTISIFMKIPNRVAMSFAPCISFFVSSYMGRGQLQEARKNGNKLIVWSFILGVFIGLMVLINCWWINPYISKGISEEMIQMAIKLQLISIPAFILVIPTRVMGECVMSTGQWPSFLVKGLVNVILCVQMLILFKTGLMDYFSPEWFITLNYDWGWILSYIVAFFVYKYYHWEKKLIKNEWVSI